MDNCTISYEDSRSSTNEMGIHKFDPNLIMDRLVEWIICDGLPLGVVKNLKFKEFCQSLEPRFEVPSLVTFARHMFRMYKARKEKLKDDLKGSVSRVSLTIDMWTSSRNTSYMCITAHFIDKSWKLHKRIISFSMVEDYRCESIGKHLEKVTKEWGIEKIMCITVNDAAENKGAMDWMKKYGSKHLLGGNYLDMRCFAHILNVIVKCGLQKCVDSVERIRNAVKYVKSSHIRQSKFLECAEHAEIANTESLCLDVATRWNSTYLMLEVAIEYELVFDSLYQEEDMDYHLFFHSGEVIGAPTLNDWENARNLISFLKPFYDSTKALSGSAYVTINNYFFQFQTIRDHLNQAQTDNCKFVSEVAVEMMVLYDQYFGNPSKVNMLAYVALVLDPRCKLEIFKRGLELFFDETTSEELFEGTKKLLQDLYEHYRSSSIALVAQSQVSQITDTSLSSSASASRAPSLWDIVCDETEYATLLSRSELDKYLADDCETPTKDFNLLNFWKAMEGIFPILASIARDIFSIPACTNVSESTFSTGDRVITYPYRSLLPRTLEALLCTQSWMKNVIAIDVDEAERAAVQELDGGAGPLDR